MILKKKIIVKKTRKTFQKDGIKWSVTAFHPTAFEKGVYAVGFWKSGKLRVDANTKFTQVIARSGEDAIKKARMELF